jgi:hypothetical protein
MWRPFAQTLLVWLSLCGLVPAALACAQTMVNHDCCPPGQQMPCDDEQRQSTIEEAACCATPSLAPTVVSIAGAQEEIDVPVPVPIMASEVPTPAIAVRTCSRQPTGPPDFRPDFSLIYLTTARLRL